MPFFILNACMITNFLMTVSISMLNLELPTN